MKTSAILKMLATTVVVPSCLLLFSGNTLAENRDFTVVNNSDYVMTGLYVSPHDASNWGSNRLAYSVQQGESVFIDLDNRGQECEFDIKVVYDNGGQDYSYGEDLCQLNELGYVLELFASPEYSSLW